ncbi:hypothetical protein FOCC_FOCC016275 [Frankliniella occidentalis]|nr:hypothetical protein FOCC_FOCC016275 [Frankliniella occidentalis]
MPKFTMEMIITRGKHMYYFLKLAASSGVMSKRRSGSSSAPEPEDSIFDSDYDPGDSDDERERNNLTPKSKRQRRNALSSEEKDEDKSRWKSKNFKDSWLNEDVFKSWLARANNKTEAKCRPCNAVLKAGRSELLKHITTDKHQKNIKAISNVRKISDVLITSGCCSEKTQSAIDESTDKGNNKNMILIVYYTDPAKGKPTAAIFEMIELDPKDCSAQAIYTKFRAVLTDIYNVPITNILGLACDNAPVMVGIHNSFYSRLKAECPWLVLLGCVCHSSAIAASHACKNLPANVEGPVRRVANYVSGSPKRSAILEEFQEHYQTEQKKLLNPSRTRWLVLHPCVVRLLENRKPLEQFFTLCSLEDPRDKEAAAILADLQNPFINAYLHFLKYTLDSFNKMNALFQSKKVMIHKLQDTCLAYLRQFCQNYMRPNVLPSVATIDVTHPHFQLPLERVYLGPGVEELLNKIPVPTVDNPGVSEAERRKMRDNDIKKFRLKCLEFYVTGANEMKKYFPLQNPVLDGARFIDPSIALSVEARSGDFPDLQVLYNHFHVPLQLDNGELTKEWRELPYTFSEDVKEKMRGFEPDRFWAEVAKLENYDGQPHFPQLVKLAQQCVLILPHSNADAERGFSVVTDTKTAKRNSMGNATLDAICVVRNAMQLRSEPCFQFNVKPEHLEKHNKDMYNKP